MSQAFTAAAMLRRWLTGDETDQDRQHTCAVTCMDYRYGEQFGGCYQVENAGPRSGESARSIDYLLRLKSPHDPIVICWLTHNGCCGCSQIETGSQDADIVEPHTARTRVAELEQLLSDTGSTGALLREAVAGGRTMVIAGHVDVTTTPRRVEFLVEETNGILARCGLPGLPADLQDTTRDM